MAMQEAVRTYLELAMGLTETSRKKVRRVVKDAVGKGGATAEQVRTLTTDLLTINSANRKALAKLVRFEVDRALGMVGLAKVEEVTELTNRVQELERQLRLAETRAESRPESQAPAAGATAGSASARATAAKAARSTAKATRATGPAVATAAPARKATRPRVTAAPGKTAGTALADPGPPATAPGAKAARAKASRAKATTPKAATKAATKAPGKALAKAPTKTPAKRAARKAQP
jgi:polyhydroxyalkanoate synthesis regulator phasin